MSAYVVGRRWRSGFVEYWASSRRQGGQLVGWVLGTEAAAHMTATEATEEVARQEVDGGIPGSVVFVQEVP